MLAGCASDSRSSAHLGFGFGKYDVEIEGVASDSTGGGLFEFAFESVPRTKFGGGVRARGIASDDDLDSSPLDPNPGTGRASDAEWFFHGTYDGAEDGKRLPLRVGLVVREFELEDSLTGEALAWSSFGPRVEFAPMLPFHQSESATVGFAGLLGLGYAVTSIEDNTNSVDWDTEAHFVDIGLGVRGAFQKATVEFGYRYHSGAYDQSDVSGGFFIRQVDTSFSGLAFSFGLTF